MLLVEVIGFWFLAGLGFYGVRRLAGGNGPRFGIQTRSGLVEDQDARIRLLIAALLSKLRFPPEL